MNRVHGAGIDRARVKNHLIACSETPVCMNEPCKRWQSHSLGYLAKGYTSDIHAWPVAWPPVHLTGQTSFLPPPPKIITWYLTCSTLVHPCAVPYPTLLRPPVICQQFTVLPDHVSMLIRLRMELSESLGICLG
jgi:hypothetical protein